MTQTIFVARPRLDCSFKEGPVPNVVGAPNHPILARFGQFIDRLEAHHRSLGHHVISDLRPLWRFELDEMQYQATHCDHLYFPHRLRCQFPIGDNALFYKNAPLNGFMTIDPAGWGASLSFLPFDVEVSESADLLFERVRRRTTQNDSIFDQPPLSGRPIAGPYHLFVCQLPHDETIKYHSDVGVVDALAATLAYCKAAGIPLLVKGHPANPKSMAPLKAMTEASSEGLWVDDISIHTCIQNAEAVFMVNSGSGMEVLLHDKPLVRFGRAEYDSAVAQARPDVASIAVALAEQTSTRERAAFISGFLNRCVELDDPGSFQRVLNDLR